MSLFKENNTSLLYKINYMVADVKETVFQQVWINTMRPRSNGCHFPNDIFKCIFLNENVSIPIDISLNFVPKGPINTVQALVQKYLGAD